MPRMKMMLLVLSLLCLAACTDEGGSAKTLEAMNLEPVKVGGYSWFGCSDDDWYSTKFTARNVKGELVTGQVCAGLFLKGATVRFN